VYTDDSDAVAILAHAGKFGLRSQPPMNVKGMSLVVRVLKGRANYAASIRHGIQSRSWVPIYPGFSFEVVRAEKIDDEALLRTDANGPAAAARRTRGNAAENKFRIGANINNIGNHGSGNNANVVVMVSPENGPAGAGRGVARLAKRRSFSHIILRYNAINEPALKYSAGLVRENLLDPSEWISARLRREVIYFDGPHGRYELSRDAESKSATDVYRWALVKDWPYPLHPMPAER